MENNLSFADKMKLNAIKPFLPMVKENLNKLCDTLLTDAEKHLDTGNGEVQACIEIARIDGQNYMLTVAMNDDNRIVRIIETKTIDQVADSLTSIITNL